MGKIVKYCSSCDESFAEKFGFCPTCGAALEAFEMNPLGARVEPETVALPLLELDSPVESEPVEVAAPIFAAPLPLITEPVIAAPAPEPEIVVPAPEPVIAAPVPEPVVEAKPEPAVKTQSAPAKAEAWPPKAAKTPVFTSPAKDADARPKSFEAEHDRYVRDGGFYVTVIEEKNVKTRNSLLLGTLVLFIFSLMGGMVYSIFSKDLNIGAINDDVFMAVLADIDPMKMDEVKEQKKKDDEGGGGGGKNEKDPASQGDLADQSKTPTRPPDVNTMKSDTPMLQTPTTEGTMKFPKIYGKWGDPNGAPGLSNGPGTGGGIGSGRGPGQGSGNGPGGGTGNGPGFGGGNQGGSPGDDGGEPPPVTRVGPSSPLKITYKQKPGYTDAARQNQVTGSVLLKVTFLASGAIGSISTVKGLPNGLTENAIAAARNMRFEPQKVNGVPQTVTKTVDFSFTIY